MRKITVKGQTFDEIPTRVPVKMHMYAKALAFALNQNLRQSYIEMTEKFLREKPWETGLKWRQTKGLSQTLTESAGRQATGWMQINMRVTPEQGADLTRIAQSADISMSSVTYTILYWWTWYVYPPAYERERRAKLQAQRSGGSKA
jgi:hypothetical protein